MQQISCATSNPESKLKFLDLNDNYIGNEGALVLANAIAGNNTLKRLDLDHSLGDAITASEWDGFLGILCNSSSINATFQSNHTLMRMWCYSWNRNGMHLPDELLFSLQANTETDKINVARQKIFHCHLNGNFNLAPFLGMDAVLLPTQSLVGLGKIMMQTKKKVSKAEDQPSTTSFGTFLNCAIFLRQRGKCDVSWRRGMPR